MGSQPDGGAKCYARNWQPYIGLSLRSLLHDPTWLQHTKRAVYYVIASPRLLPRRLREIVMAGWQRLTRHAAEPDVQPIPQRAEEPAASRRIAA